MDNKKIWIIGMSGSEWDDVVTYRVCGTKNEVKKHLAKLVRDAKKENPNSFDYGDTTMKSVQERGNKLYAGATYSSFHEDYTATPEEKPVKL